MTWQPEADPWGFEAEPVETWADVITAQAPDLAIMVAFFALALFSFHRKSVRLKYVTLIAAALLLGVRSSFLLSIVNVFGVFQGELPVFRHNLAWYVFAGGTLLTTVLFGRFYCGRVCAYGALTQLLDAVLPATWRIEMPHRIERRAVHIKFGVLAAVTGYLLITRDMGIYRYVEPFWMFGGFGTPIMWTGLALLIGVTVFVRNAYCRFLCPLGATLGLLSAVTVFPIKRWSECSTCRICQKTCEWGAIDEGRIIRTECVRCDDCERLYDDHAKCPHWRILDYKASGGRKVLPLRPVT